MAITTKKKSDKLTLEIDGEYLKIFDEISELGKSLNPDYDAEETLCYALAHAMQFIKGRLLSRKNNMNN